jgi:glyoxylase-like metal-dependent hydrolase (beta-lactamase superfamily II)
VGRSPSGPHFVCSAPVLGRVVEPAFDADGVVRLGTDLCNWFLLDDGGGEMVVVDAGFPDYRPQLEPGLRLLGRTPADLTAVVVTHGHADHVGVAEQLRQELGLPVLVHEDDAERAKTTQERGETEGSTLPYLRHPQAIRFLTHFRTSGAPQPIAEVRTYADGDELPAGLRAIHTGGHTPGHSVIHHESRRLLFAGDLLCTLNPLTGARGAQLLPRPLNLSSATMLDSLTKLEGLDVDAMLVGHGETWTQGAAAAVSRARNIGPT